MIRSIKLFFSKRKYANGLKIKSTQDILDKMKELHNASLYEDKNANDTKANLYKAQESALKWVLNLCLILCFIFSPIVSYADISIREKIVYDDDISGNSKEYFGWAKKGTATTTSTWKIMRITYTGNDFVIEWANGTEQYLNKWSDHATLSYS